MQLTTLLGGTDGCHNRSCEIILIILATNRHLDVIHSAREEREAQVHCDLRQLPAPLCHLPLMKEIYILESVDRDL